MNKQRNKLPKAAKPQRAAATEAKGRKMRATFQPKTARRLTYIVGFALIYALLSWGYGDVLARAQQESYISASPTTMQHLLSQPLGGIYWLARWALLAYKCLWVGALLLAFVYTLTARLTDYALRLPRRFEGVGFIVPLTQVGWMLWRGTNLYYKNEPSLFIVVAMCVLLVTALAALAVWVVVRRRAQQQTAKRVRPYGLLVAALLSIGMTWAARHYNENVVLTAKMQLLTQQERWDDIIALARQARRPSRAVAAYHAVALEESDQLLEGMFDIPYDFPKINFDKKDGNEEYGIFSADCNLHAGLLNAAYRNGMDHVVMNGPSVYHYKLMAVAALLNNERSLCQKYLSLIGAMPFEQSFVNGLTELLRQPSRIKEDATLAHILSLSPLENNTEQNYRQPLFLGYNAGVLQGTNATLVTSAAACLYAKDLQAFLPRAMALAQKGHALPQCMQQAICIMAMKDRSLLNEFPQVNRFVMDEVTNLLIDCKPYINDHQALRRELKDKWLGTYAYYYYTENNDPDQVEKPKSTKTQVN